jgi:hypothetical protein
MAAILTAGGRYLDTRPEIVRLSVSPADRREIVLLKVRPFVFAGIENVQTAVPPAKPLDWGRSG